MLRSDGFRLYPLDYRKAEPEKVHASATRYISRSKIYGLKDFVMLDPELRKLLSNLLGLMQRDGVMVELFLSPYHPMVFDFLSSSDDYRIVLEAEKYIRAVATEKKIPIIGSYNPARLNLTATDFYDGMHPKTEAINKIFRSTDD